MTPTQYYIKQAMAGYTIADFAILTGYSPATVKAWRYGQRNISDRAKRDIQRAMKGKK